MAEHHAANPSRARAAILRLTSEQAATLFVDDSLDFCYIDAQHDFLSVMQDITRWWPKVRSGGIIAGFISTLLSHLPCSRVTLLPSISTYLYISVLYCCTYVYGSYLYVHNTTVGIDFNFNYSRYIRYFRSRLQPPSLGISRSIGFSTLRPGDGFATLRHGRGRLGVLVHIQALRSYSSLTLDTIYS